MANHRINSRTKGSKNERDLAKLFKTWTGKDFARTPSSGGLQWKATNAKGDIVCTSEGHYFPFCIEAKNHKEINFEHLLYLPKPKILEFWEQCLRDATLANKVPLLFMRYNGMPKDFHFVVMKSSDFQNLFYPTITPFKIRVQLKVKDLNLSLVTSPEFFQTNYKSAKKKAKQLIGYGKKK
jgi:Holliday junction resolvase